jgi:hypothetical protein
MALAGQETCKDLISINFLDQSISTINHAVISPTIRLGELVYTPSRKKQTAIFVCCSFFVVVVVFRNPTDELIEKKRKKETEKNKISSPD